MQGLVMPGLTGVTPIELVLPQLSGLSAEELSQASVGQLCRLGDTQGSP